MKKEIQLKAALPQTENYAATCIELKLRDT
jgi:hypothetical protein